METLLDSQRGARFCHDHPSAIIKSHVSIPPARIRESLVLSLHCRNGGGIHTSLRLTALSSYGILAGCLTKANQPQPITPFHSGSSLTAPNPPRYLASAYLILHLVSTGDSWLCFFDFPLCLVFWSNQIPPYLQSHGQVGHCPFEHRDSNSNAEISTHVHLGMLLKSQDELVPAVGVGGIVNFCSDFQIRMDMDYLPVLVHPLTPRMPPSASLSMLQTRWG